MFDAGLDRYMGGENLASGRAVLTSIEQHPARLFQIDELGMFLRTVTGKNAPGHKMEIWSELTKLYSRAKGTYGGTEYANQKENARVNLQQPHACLYGMTTPSTFWSAMEGGAMVDGSMARFLVFVTDDHRPDRNRNPGIVKPSEELLNALREVSEGVAGHDYGGNLAATMSATVSMTPYRVPWGRGAEELHYKRLTDDEDAWALRVVGTPQAATVNRLGENAIKLSVIRAVSRHPQCPTIEQADVMWGWDLALHCARTLLKDAGRFIADNDLERKMNKAREIIQRFGPISASDMVEKGLKVSSRERSDVLQLLVEEKSIKAVEYPAGPKGGRPTIRYSSIRFGSQLSEEPSGDGSCDE
jgi:hypothetical protein